MREKAIKWCNEIVKEEDKQLYVNVVISSKRSYKTVTGREIEIMYRYEKKL